MKYVESPKHLKTKCNTYIDYKPGGSSQCPYKNEFTHAINTVC